MFPTSPVIQDVLFEWPTCPFLNTQTTQNTLHCAWRVWVKQVWLLFLNYYYFWHLVSLSRAIFRPLFKKNVFRCVPKSYIPQIPGPMAADCRLIVVMLIGYSVRSFLTCLSDYYSNASTVSKCAFLSKWVRTKTKSISLPNGCWTRQIRGGLTSVSCKPFCGAQCCVCILFLY